MKKWFPKILFLTGSFCLLVSCNDLQQKQQPAGEDPAVNISENIPEEASEKELETSPEEIRGQLSKKKGDSTIAKFYEIRSYAPVWTSPKKRSAFLGELQKADSEGLSIKDYYHEELRHLLENAAELGQEEAAQLDIQLTGAFLSYAHDLYYGKLDPKKLYKNWGVSRKNKDLPAILQQGLENDNIAEALEDLKPSHQIYRDLKVSLQEYAELRESESSFDKIREGELIKPGEKDPRLSAIANRLTQLGHLSEEFTDSIYSTKLQEAVRSYQKEKGLQMDGLIGNSTIAELNMTVGERYKQILANLERWRWYPRDLGEHYILINIPQFKLSVVKEGDTVRTHNVIAGTRARQTPIFSDTIRYVVINPTWTIPPTIKVQDIIPKVSRDPSYLTNKNMKVYSKDGTLLDPEKIDWSSPQARSYTIIQRAGPTNPLGQVKIIYPNQYLIYLHDTPAQNLFSQNQRAESSGCVRVENAVDLSGYVLRDQEEWNEEKIRETIASGKTIQVKINQPIQVHHFYWTAWRAGGKTIFTEDVYRLDKEIYTRLSAD
ncbi:Murein L,D-transpeptidase YcbB/YkuD [Salinimicrobium catena]|uniref:Murein L,D-transpeptidase YcbB/YkuD n=1 Tax=Salinimicrobium catena TaxID=390640 RepID=A0A1H5PCN1_9FLAO|nr:L,D-transpeptidase family protein [Salinimicrobium catena]SDL79338.1 Murein L,D-transpeptidase YcbB/YkuD [Salinimicrobium catena]SEF11682.1 Murein L,D-transpeptidase YcbB/YkuD [Salinimicrobium catena]